MYQPYAAQLATLTKRIEHACRVEMYGCRVQKEDEVLLLPGVGQQYQPEGLDCLYRLYVCADLGILGAGQAARMRRTA